MNDMRKLMEAATLLEYLMREGDSIKKLLDLNVFGDTGHTEGDGIVYGPNDVSWEEGEIDPQLQKEWLREVKPYAQKAGKLKNAIMKAAAKGRKLTDAEVEAAEGTWYDGSDLYNELEFAFEELPGVWDRQIEVVTDIINGDIVDDEEGDYAPFGDSSNNTSFGEGAIEEAGFNDASGMLRGLLRDVQQLERDTAAVYKEAASDYSKARPDYTQMLLNELEQTIKQIHEIVEMYENAIPEDEY